MSWKAAKEYLLKIAKPLSEYRYAALIIIVGIVMMLYPAKKSEVPNLVQEESIAAGDDLEERLSAVLSQVEGAGKVRVILTCQTSEERFYQENVVTVTNEMEQELQKELVILEDQAGQEHPVPVKTKYPTYRGAVVVCQGANRASVRLDIIRAVSSLTGLGSDKITVIKMRGN